MMLSDRIAYFYQAASISFVITIMLNLQPIALASLYIMVFISIYAILASKCLKNTSAELFASSIALSPNPSSIGDEVSVSATITPPKISLPAIIKLDLGELKLLEGSNTWSGLLNDEISLSFSIKSSDPGIKTIGPLRIAVMDPLGILVKELEIHHKVPLFILENIRAFTSPSACHSTAYPSPGFSHSQLIGINYEYETSQPIEAEPPARIIDWRRTAQYDEVYIKSYSKLRKGDLIFGMGSGLNIILPNGLKVSSKIMEEILIMALPHLDIGSKILLMKWDDGEGVFTASLIEKHGLIELHHPPRVNLIIHVTRLIDERELIHLKELISQGALIKLILVNLGTDISKMITEEWIMELADFERRRLESMTDELGIPYVMSGLEELGECLKRILSYRRPI